VAAASEDGRQGTETEDEPLIWRHLPLLLTTVSFVFVVVKVYRVAGSDSATAQAIVSSSGVPSVVLGALVSLLPSLVTLAAFLSALLLYYEVGRRSQRRLWWEVLVAGPLFGLLLLPWPSAVVLFVILTAYVVARVWRAKREKEVVDKTIPDWPALAFSILISTFITPTMWLPPEVVSLVGEPEEVAYVLSSDSEWTTLLEDGSRRVIVVRTDDVESRTVCNLTGRPPRSLMQVIEGDGGQPNPECPDS
jgi:hypothetical protein